VATLPILGFVCSRSPSGRCTRSRLSIGFSPVAICSVRDFFSSDCLAGGVTSCGLTGFAGFSGFDLAETAFSGFSDGVTFSPVSWV